MISGVPRADDLTDEQLMRIARGGLEDEQDERGGSAARRSYVIDAPPDLSPEEWIARHKPRSLKDGS